MVPFILLGKLDQRKRRELKDRPAIYALWFEGEEEYYVGSTKRIASRLSQHKTFLRGGRFCNQEMCRRLDKYGPQAVCFGILEFCAEDELEVKEVFWFGMLPALNKRRPSRATVNRQIATLKALYARERKMQGRE